MRLVEVGGGEWRRLPASDGAIRRCRACGFKGALVPMNITEAIEGYAASVWVPGA